MPFFSTDMLRRQMFVADALMTHPGEIIVHAGMAVEHGRIMAVGPVDQLRSRFSGITEQHFPGHLLCPGFVNAHTHLELSFLCGKIPGPIAFPDWVLQLFAQMPHPDDTANVIAHAARQGAAECIRFGVTTVGDITRWPEFTRPKLAGGPLRVVSFGEITALGKRRDLLQARLDAALSSQAADEYVSIGVSPHAPYSVEGPALRKVVTAAEIHQVPLAMHLAENTEEGAFLATLDGPLGRSWPLMQKLDILDEQVPRFVGGPIRWGRQYGLLSHKNLKKSAGLHAISIVLAHVNYADDAELKILADSGASVAWCPRTHAYFGHHRRGEHPWKKMLDRSIPVCLATDSLASNPDLSLLREARHVWQCHPEISPVVLMEMITTRPAQALGLSEHIGRLAAGFSADAVLLPLDTSTGMDTSAICAAMVHNAPEPAAVWVMGRRVK